MIGFGSSALGTDPVVTADQSISGFRFDKIPPPAVDDAGVRAEIAIVEGKQAPNAMVAALNDGKVPTKEDEPRANFFFASGTDGGRLRLDLGKATEVSRIATYSCHPSTRGPQVYTLYASRIGARGFNPRPSREIDPAEAGWVRIAEVDTRNTSQADGPQHGVLISAGDGDRLGTFRYLLFDTRATSMKGPFGNTFYSEIDVIAAGAGEPKRIAAAKPVAKTFESGEFRFTINATEAPDLMPWVEKELMPAVYDWYPRMIAMLPSKGFSAPKSVAMEFRNNMRAGVPAFASGNRIVLSVPFFRQQLKGEAKGCVIHELVHVIQSYHRARFTNPEPKKTPGWITEGTADYVRWFLFEPEKNGARITGRMLDAGAVRHDASYRITGNFIDWVVRNRDKDLLRKLNEAAREGRYSDALWETWTGTPLDKLGALWIDDLRRQLER